MPSQNCQAARLVLYIPSGDPKLSQPKQLRATTEKIRVIVPIWSPGFPRAKTTRDEDELNPVTPQSEDSASCAGPCCLFPEQGGSGTNSRTRSASAGLQPHGQGSLQPAEAASGCQSLARCGAPLAASTGGQHCSWHPALCGAQPLLPGGGGTQRCPLSPVETWQKHAVQNMNGN